MRLGGFSIRKIATVGSNRPDAALFFQPGLNVIAGASNTGKTYAFELIDFMLGASKPPKKVPLEAGYTSAYMEIIDAHGQVLTIKRSLAGGDASVYSVAEEEIKEDTEHKIVGASHQRGDKETISGVLLTLSSLFGNELRKNERGEKQSLSFRDVAWLTVIDEVRIIADTSPALSGQYIAGTVERSAFGLFLKGVDDSSIIAQEKPALRKARLNTEIDTLQGLIEERQKRLEQMGLDLSDLPGQRGRLAAAVERASHAKAVQQSQLDAASASRNEIWNQILNAQSRRHFLEEQLKRLRLLQGHYASDSARLQSSKEAGDMFERLPTGQCPVCGHDGESATEHSNATLAAFRSACNAELSKIDVLARDLRVSVNEIEAEDASVVAAMKRLGEQLDRANQEIERLLSSEMRLAEDELSALLSKQQQLAQAAFITGELADLGARLERVQEALKVKVRKLDIPAKVDTGGTAGFCKVIAATLKAWKFPFDGVVTWSENKFDIVIGSEGRGDLGKGYRAITHAAFTISLMRYCRANGLPHPGIVVIDTPLNPFKGPDKDSPEKVNEEVQQAFYADLAADVSGDQFIVFENTEPAADVRQRIQYEHFSGNPHSGRAGFFPPLPVQPKP